MRKLLAIAALLPTCAVASTPPDSINEIFAGTCMKHFYSQDVLRKSMSDTGAPEAPPDRAEFFLAGKPGKAWSS
ncbi:MAG: NMCC_0638 family (lipo)protein [Luteimonas sp.]